MVTDPRTLELPGEILAGMLAFQWPSRVDIEDGPRPTSVDEYRAWRQEGLRRAAGFHPGYGALCVLRQDRTTSNRYAGGLGRTSDGQPYCDVAYVDELATGPVADLLRMTREAIRRGMNRE